MRCLIGGPNMRAVKCNINWHTKQLCIVVDAIPTDLVYEIEYDVFYYAEKEGYVKYYVYAGPGKGFYGLTTRITLKNGEEIELTGPYSSGASVVNRYFPHCVDVAIREEKDSPYCFFAGAVTIEFAKEALLLCDEDVELVEEQFHNDTIYIPRKREIK